MSSEAIFASLSNKSTKKISPKKSIVQTTKPKKIKETKPKTQNSKKKKEVNEEKSPSVKNSKDSKTKKGKKALEEKNLNKSDSDFALGRLSSDENSEEEEEIVKKTKEKTQKDAKSPKEAKKQKKKEPKKVKYDEEDEETCNQDDELLCAAPDQLLEPKPLLSLNPDGTLPELPSYVNKVLREDFKHKSFRPNQAEAVLRIICGLSTLVVLSTGYGKSLIYQMAARLYAKRYPGSTVLVVSPLISLMQDQLHNISKCLKAAVCDSQLDEKEFESLVHDLNDGKINILFMSPEAIMNKKIRTIPRLAFVCIDEVHCLSQWSHNFRPSYLQLCRVKFNFIRQMFSYCRQKAQNLIRYLIK